MLNGVAGGQVAEIQTAVNDSLNANKPMTVVPPSVPPSPAEKHIIECGYKKHGKETVFECHLVYERDRPKKLESDAA